MEQAISSKHLFDMDVMAKYEQQDWTNICCKARNAKRAVTYQVVSNQWGNLMKWVIFRPLLSCHKCQYTLEMRALVHTVNNEITMQVRF